MKRTYLSLALALLLLACLPLTAAAHAVPDLTRTDGSITVTMRYQGKPVSGGSLTLYQVGEVVENDGNYAFVPVAALQSRIGEFADIQSPELAQTLAGYAKEKIIPAITTKTIGTDGAVTFSNLGVGLYLLMQQTAAKGYGKASPFLVSVPYLEDDQYVYHVSSAPKTGLEREVKPTQPPVYGDSLPQTGQLWWPVPVLLCVGLACIAAGLIRRRRTSDER